jgi:hypothetical protein
MKLLINGCTVTEHIEIKRNRKDIKLAGRILEHTKTNKAMYAKLVISTALIIHININVFALDIATSMDSTFNQLIDLLLSFARWGCLGMGLKSSIESMLNGGSLKQASMSGIQYWLAYIFLQLYPKLFDMIKL